MSYLNQISMRPNFSLAELGQCHVRLAIGVAGGGWYLFWLPYAESADAATGLKIVGSYFAYAMLHWYWTRSKPGFNPWRLLIVLVADQTVTASLMMHTHELGYFFVFVGPWVSIGNGIRFGKKLMFVSASIAVINLIMAGIYSEYWQQHITLLIGLLILNTAVPAYVAILLTGLEKSRSKLAGYAEKMEQLALRDALTGLPNRSALFEELNKVCSYAERNHLMVALLYFDLDGFKKVNDAYGHSVGDLLLKETAMRVSEVLRSEDVIARLGGDEFVVLLQGPDSVERASLVADRILQAVLSIDAVQGLPVEVSASLGGIVLNGTVATLFSAEHLLHEADKNMYHAKKAGKNRAILTAFTNEVDTTFNLQPV